MSLDDTKTQMNILLTGATGYVGGRLLGLLEAGDFNLRCLARHPEFLKDKVSSRTQIAKGDVLDKSTLLAALSGIHTAFYLIHSMSTKTNFLELEKQAAINFAQAAEECNVNRIIYLGGLGDETDKLSPHLNSRQEVGRILRNSRVKTIEFRASIVLGSGSLSFEMIRALTEKIPVMVMPRWVNVTAQPIGITDLLRYLYGAIQLDVKSSMVIEIGGADQLSYRELMKEYAHQRGLKRYMIRVPVLTPYLSSLWLGLVTPIYARVGKKLIRSVKHPTVVTTDTAKQLFHFQPVSARDAIASALRNEDREFRESNWYDSVSSTGIQEKAFGGTKVGSRLMDTRSLFVNTTPEKAFRPIYELGGRNGWYAYNFLWTLRGNVDLLLGGVGMRRGRPRRNLRNGDSIDFWRIEVLEYPERLRLKAEMKLPGKAWLEFEVSPEKDGARIHQTAVFYPKGLFGLLYWYGIFPLHALVFRGMIKEIGRRALNQ